MIEAGFHEECESFVGAHVHGRVIRGDLSDRGYDPGTRVRKRRSSIQDRTTDGSFGTVIGVLADETALGYFVAWDAQPRLAVFVMGAKVERIA